MTRSCKGCEMDCWGKEYDPLVKKYFCIANGEYLTTDSKGYPEEKEVVEFT